MTEHSHPDKPMPTTTHRIELVKQLRAEAKAAQLNLDGIPGVIAGGILHLADLCDKAADEIERRDEDRAYGEKQFALSATKDTARLDLMERTESYPFKDFKGWKFVVGKGQIVNGATAREALDAAIALSDGGTDKT